MLFFVLSGFVLSLPFYKRAVPGNRFVIRRILRLYPAYAVATVLAAVLAATVSRHGIPGLSEWFNLVWIAPLSGADVVRTLLLVDSFDPIRIDPPFWSLVHEMRISLLFPILMLFVLRQRWWTLMLFALALSGLGYAASEDGAITGTLHTARYLVLFVAGALIGKHMESLGQRYRRLPSTVKWLFGLLGLLLYTWVYWFNPAYHPSLTKLTAQWTAGMGACIILITTVFSPKVSQLLTVRPLQFLGRISYSLYLVHVPILMATLYLLYGVLPTGAILILATALSLCLATALHRSVELTGIRVGRLLERPRERAVARGEFNNAA